MEVKVIPPAVVPPPTVDLVGLSVAQAERIRDLLGALPSDGVFTSKNYRDLDDAVEAADRPYTHRFNIALVE